MLRLCVRYFNACGRRTTGGPWLKARESTRLSSSAGEVGNVEAPVASSLLWSVRIFAVGMTVAVASCVIPIMDSMLPMHSVTLCAAKEDVIARAGIKRISVAARRGATRRALLVSSNALPVLVDIVTRKHEEDVDERKLKEMEVTREMALAALTVLAVDLPASNWLRERAGLVDFLRSSSSVNAHNLLESINRVELLDSRVDGDTVGEEAATRI